jgi:hypothetical protein
MTGARRRAFSAEQRMFIWLALAMAFTIVVGFSLQWLMGRSSFTASPMRLHVHGLLFMGWVGLYLTQTMLGVGAFGPGSIALHRRLGWLGAGWASAMVVVGVVLTVGMIRRGAVPFFFTPAYFLFMDTVSVLTFAGLVAAAIVQRRRTAWHNRLMVCAMAVLTGPAIGRIVPAPLLIPWVGLSVFLVIVLFPLAGMIADRRRHGVHPAWLAGLATLVAMQLAIELLPRSAAGLAVYRAVAARSPGAAVAPDAYPPPPWARAPKGG